MSPAIVTWAGDEGTAVVEVSATGAAAQAVHDAVPALLGEHVASRLAAQDVSLWGEGLDVGDRLGWTDLHQTSRELVERVTALREELRAEGLDRVVLAGMGGSSLAAEVITGSVGTPLTVLDSTVPTQVERVLEGDLARTVLVVASRSGTTVETDSHRRAFVAALQGAGRDPARHVVVVTKPGSPLEELAREEGYRAVFSADPRVGGRFSALSAYGLVPSALAGVDVGRLLDEAAEVAPFLAEDTEANPALVLGAALAATSPLRETVLLVDAGSGLYHFGAWAEQLLAESLGKDGRGLVPVVVDEHAPELAARDARTLPVLLTPLADDDAAAELDDVADGARRVAVSADLDADTESTEITVSGSLGGTFLLWQHAVAVAGRLLGVNPFDQPDVEATKQATREFLSGMPSLEPPAFSDSGVEVRAARVLLAGARTVPDAVTTLLDQLDSEHGYLAVLAYLDREGRAPDLLRGVRDGLAARTGRPVTFGWGPRYLHSTGQLHKGGPPHGVYLMITGGAPAHVSVPGRDFDFAELVAAQADADARVLTGLGRPVLRLRVDTPDALAWLTGSLTRRTT
ncbi:glucose-6-phosphate isomerase [Georgenia satyanarayanai]|uniref:glucose-6-phosphate isomerase n=1 Tax=Georgenia satyanarayanai TaxID=860221 RepID=UPI0020419F5C|nr:glucose-6-phosphate isomerase [Georgenia satyanarayanai]MCM3660021.1 glucose-6-phosphate isomerase [Georgenia satyanarayanai]